MEPHGVESPRFPEMEPHVTEEERSTSALWDWSDLLDFTTDDRFDLPIVSDQIELNPETEPQPEPPVVSLNKVRKRDPRLICSNFLAGRIPCACPEVDAMLAEEEATLPGKKRVRTVRTGSGQARCQVPGCEVDISELKGYHKRHRVCLRCANASAVLLDGESKRYCQQCGKFHVLSDFDEGKRSCRRKLERHNNRRRRKSVDSKGAMDNEPLGATQSEDLGCESELGKDSLCLSSQITDQEPFFESEDGHVSTLHSAPNSQNVNSDSGVSFAASGEIQTDGGKDDSKGHSPSYCENKSANSSLCPTGRISFKLYDWNPAEFPRRLRHQIFQWLASMPVELEGYIRPGCTILTVFIAMPKIMWVKLYEDPITYLHDFVVTPGRMLSGRGSIFVHLNNMIFHVKEIMDFQVLFREASLYLSHHLRILLPVSDGTSVVKVNVEVKAPRLHYVHPTCFEAGKPMEFVACGSNLLQHKLRFLISFAGKYLPYDCCVASSHGQSEGDPLAFDHQLYKIYVPHTEPDHFGPAFIEVENESGLSNFIPVLIGDKEICCEMRIIQDRFEASHFPERAPSVSNGSLFDLCEASTLRQTAFTELVLDIAWLLKVPASESFQQFMSSSQVQRFNSLFNFLLNYESTAIMEKMLQNLKILMDNTGLNRGIEVTMDSDMGLLLGNMDHVRDILDQKLQKNGEIIPHSGNIVTEKSHCSQSCSTTTSNVLVSITNQDSETTLKGKVGAMVASNATDTGEIVPLLSSEVVMNVSLVKEWPRKSCGHIFTGSVFSSRPTIFVIAVTAVCFGICVVLLHPHKVSDFAVSIRRSLFGSV
ncbi:hypothetical protein Patl1_25532 [Pistacia atlantica]|uniref:Uncharacterized protein n=1 Tax=Pistacia atlantica TaxID=434234 RepID=A0ACC1AZQ9_9ROSI|nr:hypothetical protein Patl1_25532 [Pistacia atlantica]